LLLGCDESGGGGGGKEGRLDWRALPKHNDEDQVKLDVNRSFIYYPSGWWLLSIREILDDTDV
jgi:hypothetical protein